MPQFHVSFVETARHPRDRPHSSLVVHDDDTNRDTRERERGSVRIRDEEQYAAAQLAYHAQARRAKENGKVPVCMIVNQNSPPIFSFVSSSETIQDVWWSFNITLFIGGMLM